MTVADPRGQWMDDLRSCYTSWMHVPEGRIRVRWYAIDDVKPGYYPLSPYCSSNWDEDPKGLDPELGEESTTRKPYTEWVDCSPPPWTCPERDDCPFQATTNYTAYHATIKGFDNPDMNGEALFQLDFGEGVPG